MNVIPCRKNPELRRKIEEFAETLMREAHLLGDHGLPEDEFYASGVFRGAVERVRGQYSATMREKREFVRHVLNYMQDRGFVADWRSAGEKNRHDYSVDLPSGRTAVIELKGCLDGNNTNIFERPAHANEFIIWSVCTNRGADPRRNAWSGIHTRLSAEIISRSQRVDGLVVWDYVCGSLGRPCPKTIAGPGRATHLAQYRLPPPCVYVFPDTIPSPRNNPHARAQELDDVELLRAFHDCFSGLSEEVNYVDIQVAHRGAETVRKTTVTRNGSVVKESAETAIRRS